MQILRWQAGNALRNYQYIVVDDEKNAALVDPFDGAEIDAVVKRENLKVKAILVTHEHDDHAALAPALQERYGAAIFCSTKAKEYIQGQCTSIDDNAAFRFSPEFDIRLYATPGHTATHAVFEMNGFLFSGDALFHAGCGHCRSASSNMEEHFRTLHERLAKLPGDLILMPGHYYAARNLDFSLHLEPHNRRARELRAKIQCDADELEHHSTLKQEYEYNAFLRLDQRHLRARLSALSGRNLTEAEPLVVFSELRKLRDAW